MTDFRITRRCAQCSKQISEEIVHETKLREVDQRLGTLFYRDFGGLRRIEYEDDETRQMVEVVRLDS